MSDPIGNEQILDGIIQAATLSADLESVKPAPVSSVPNPDGSRQSETRSERERRIIGAAIRHSVAAGLLVIAPDAAARMEGGISLMPR